LLFLPGSFAEKDKAMKLHPCEPDIEELKNIERALNHYFSEAFLPDPEVVKKYHAITAQINRREKAN
jgi:hypothetical protein